MKPLKCWFCGHDWTRWYESRSGPSFLPPVVVTRVRECRRCRAIQIQMDDGP
jgi:hypothetical protein